MDNIIEIKDLYFSYNESTPVLKGLNLTIARGENVAILGPNGSGKSTIAKLLLGLIEAQSGQIIVNGLELNLANLYDVRKNIGMVFQNPDNQFIGSTVRDDIAFGLENICVPQEEMDDIIIANARKVHMEKFLDHEPKKLSGGQKQRVAIAGCLAMEPNIIILDEATSMLDPLGRGQINRSINKISKDKNITVISITHDIEAAKEASRVVVVNNGVVQREGRPDEVFLDQDFMEAMRLDVPFALKVSSELKKSGYNINKTIDEKELVDQICQLNLKK
ncbi:MAG: energy-coupling factor transporter ATPase [Erysipelotrichaceae bacterium]|nr:energy-coupling factor transporter ATPase [Erysipelotrichaceae bacterium]MDD3809903.1 energy-coupling factor transporter ATPase [Erysipelotrichaceae bacterium]